MLEARNVSRRIGDRWLLRQVSLSVAAGRILSLVGPSGCGKTTLLRLLALLNGPDEGEVVCAGRSLAQSATDADGWYPTVTLVAQGYPLWPHLSLRDMRAMLPVRPDHDSHWEELGLVPLLDRLPGQLSSGQRQRAALALALDVKPKVLLLDEITSAQDVEHCDTIANLLKAQAAQGTAVVLSTHLLHFASGVADEFAFLDHGSVLEQGPVAQMKEPKTERLRKFMFVGM